MSPPRGRPRCPNPSRHPSSSPPPPPLPRRRQRAPPGKARAVPVAVGSVSPSSGVGAAGGFSSIHGGGSRRPAHLGGVVRASRRRSGEAQLAGRSRHVVEEGASLVVWRPCHGGVRAVPDLCWPGARSAAGAWQVAWWSGGGAGGLAKTCGGTFLVAAARSGGGGASPWSGRWRRCGGSARMEAWRAASGQPPLGSEVSGGALRWRWHGVVSYRARDPASRRWSE